jgi:hypothetical protein
MKGLLHLHFTLSPQLACSSPLGVRVEKNMILIEGCITSTTFKLKNLEDALKIILSATYLSSYFPKW